MRIGIDIDGVLYEWDEPVRDALVARFRIQRPDTSTTWNYLKDVLTPEQWAWLWTQEGQALMFGDLDSVYPGAVAMVNALTRDPKLKVHFVTHRDPRRAGAQTTSFLLRHFAAHPWAGVHVLQNGTPKHTLAKWDAFIDDKPETVLAMLNAGVPQVFAPRRPWNEYELLPLMHTPWAARFLLYEDPAEVVERLAA